MLHSARQRQQNSWRLDVAAMRAVFILSGRPNSMKYVWNIFLQSGIRTPKFLLMLWHHPSSAGFVGRSLCQPARFVSCWCQRHDHEGGKRPDLKWKLAHSCLSMLHILNIIKYKIYFIIHCGILVCWAPKSSACNISIYTYIYLHLFPTSLCGVRFFIAHPPPLILLLLLLPPPLLITHRDLPCSHDNNSSHVHITSPHFPSQYIPHHHLFTPSSHITCPHQTYSSSSRLTQTLCVLWWVQ